jgi:hypothetical protein
VGDLAYQDYGAERGLQQQAAGLLSGYQNQAAMAQRAYQDQAAGAAPALAQGLLGMLNQTGATQTAHNQAILDAAKARFNEQQLATAQNYQNQTQWRQGVNERPWERLQHMQGLLGLGSGAGTQTQRQPGVPLWQQVLGGAFGAANLGNTAFSAGGPFASGGAFGPSATPQYPNLSGDVMQMLLRTAPLW